MVVNPDEYLRVEKSSGCVRLSANGNYSPGNDLFFQSPDGLQTCITYTATSNSAGACDNSTYTTVQLLGTHSDSNPNFGAPRQLLTCLRRAFGRARIDERCDGVF